MKMVDVIVVGGGASGLMCAYVASSRGRSVLLLEGSNKVGKKILMSGGGRCNFTNLYVTPEHFISHNPHFVKSALANYTQYDFIKMVQDHNIEYEERKHGQLFCVRSAKDILSMLLTVCEQQSVRIETHVKVSDIQPLSNDGDYRFQVSANDTQYQCQSLVMASGALSIPSMGATGFAYEVAQQFGLNVLPRRAGLVPFTFSDHIKSLSEQLSGLSVSAELTTRGVSFSESILFTHRGLSGPAVLQLSNYWREGDTVEVNLCPELALESYLLEQKNTSKSLLRTVLMTYLPKALVLALEERMWPTLKDIRLAEFPDQTLRDIAAQLHAWPLKPSGTEGYRTAEVTLGGVDTDHIRSKDMQVTSRPGLYFIGEALDVTGHLGGFNFQWAWSSGVAAGQSV
ncbi:MAG: NAD(P)/FAD-dependent oxidoreductase [Pseudomonadota bacterium]